MGSAPTQSAQPSTPSSAGKGTPTQNFQGQVLANQMTNDSRMNPTSAPTPTQGGKGTPMPTGYPPVQQPTPIPAQGGKAPLPTAVPTPMPTGYPPAQPGQITPNMTPQQIGDMIRAMQLNQSPTQPGLGSMPLDLAQNLGNKVSNMPMQPGYRAPVTQPKGPPLPYGHPGGIPVPGRMSPTQPAMQPNAFNGPMGVRGNDQPPMPVMPTQPGAAQSPFANMTPEQVAIIKQQLGIPQPTDAQKGLAGLGSLPSNLANSIYQ